MTSNHLSILGQISVIYCETQSSKRFTRRMTVTRSIGCWRARQLQNAFHNACREAGLIGGPADWNRELLRVRKTGGFPKRGKTKKATVTDDELDAYSFAAEIAWRLTSDKFGCSLAG